MGKKHSFTFSHAEGNSWSRKDIRNRTQILIMEFLPRFCKTMGGNLSSPGPRLGPNVDRATSTDSGVMKLASGLLMSILLLFEALASANII